MPHVDEGQLHAWIDGETSVSDAERIDHHLAKCEDCSARMEDVARVHARVGELIASARGASAPAWEELVAQAQAADAAEHLAGEPGLGHDSGPALSAPTRGLWTPRLLTSGLAWAATLVLAFGLGWYAGLRPKEASLPGVELQAEVGPPAEEKRTVVAKQQDPVRQVVAEQPAPSGTTASTPAGDEREELTEGPAPAVPTPPARPTDGRNEPAENRAAAVAEERAQVSDGLRLARADAAPAPQTQLSPAPTRERQSVLEAVDAAGVLQTDAVARSPELDAGSIAPRDIAVWLGRQPLRLEGAIFDSATLAPLSTGPRSPGAAGVWMLFDDPQSGTSVAVAQRRWPQDDDADQPAVAKDADTAVLTVIAGGAPQLWWITADSYLVLITADVDEATLRELAQRLR